MQILIKFDVKLKKIVNILFDTTNFTIAIQKHQFHVRRAFIQTPTTFFNLENYVKVRTPKD